MVMMKGKLQLEKQAYQEFMKLWEQGKFQGQRLGQAFYNHFTLHKLADQDQLRGLYEKDGDAAKQVLEQVFKFN